MTKRSRLGLVTAAFAAAAMRFAFAAEPSACKLVPIDEWHVQPGTATPTIDGFINGQRIDILLDTGVTLPQGAMLDRAAARRLGIPISADFKETVGGLGGPVRLSTAMIDEIRIGQAKRHAWGVIVAGEDHGQAGFFILGNRFFEKVELEFDLPHNVVRLFRSEGCRGQSLAYWTWTSGEAANALPIWVAAGGRLTVGVEINDTEVRAVVDSGAWRSLIDASVAARLGVTTTSPGTKPGVCTAGAGEQLVESWVGQFSTFTIGGEKILNPTLYFVDMRRNMPTNASLFWRVDIYDAPEMLLGADFLRTHRVLISRPHGKMFFTYTGGTVFPTESKDDPCGKARRVTDAGSSSGKGFIYCVSNGQMVWTHRSKCDP